MKTKVINFIGGPGSGKSTHSANLFAYMKRKEINCELTAEYAKGVTWRGAPSILTNQLYVFAKQYDAQFRLNGKVKYIISDSPLLLSLYYGSDKESKEFKDLVRVKWNEFDNINFFVNRTKSYNPSGRNQTIDEADQISLLLLKILKDEGIEFNVIESNTNVEDIYSIIAGRDDLSSHAYYTPGMV
jgi:adenylate kinase family enzyme